jgi:glyceraldehyde 3-phosphate dehydrogenase
VLHEALGIEKGIVQTVHSYTSTQSLVDGPGKKDDFLRGRAAAVNIVPSSTGAAEAVAKSVTALKGKFTGIAIRVPTPAGSLAMFTCVTSKNTTTEEVNELYRKAAAEKRWQGILGISEDALVSSDIVGRTEPALIDLPSTKVVGGNLVTVYSWYDNEWGYTHSLVEHVARVARLTANR